MMFFVRKKHLPDSRKSSRNQKMKPLDKKSRSHRPKKRNSQLLDNLSRSQGRNRKQIITAGTLTGSHRKNVTVLRNGCRKSRAVGNRKKVPLQIIAEAILPRVPQIPLPGTPSLSLSGVIS